MVAAHIFVPRPRYVLYTLKNFRRFIERSMYSEQKWQKFDEKEDWK